MLLDKVITIQVKRCAEITEVRRNKLKLILQFQNLRERWTWRLDRKHFIALWSGILSTHSMTILLSRVYSNADLDLTSIPQHAQFAGCLGFDLETKMLLVLGKLLI